MTSNTKLSLCFRYVRLALTQMRKTDAVRVTGEMLDIQKELNLTHEQIIERVFPILLDEEQDYWKGKKKS